MMQKWEYTMVYLDTDEALNGLGADGWELMYVERIKNCEYNCVFCVLKRPIQREVELKIQIEELSNADIASIYRRAGIVETRVIP